MVCCVHRIETAGKGTNRYAGLLHCKECGNPFVPMIRYWNGKRRVEYVCKGYHRNGKDFCASHRIHEEALDGMVWAYITSVREDRVKEQAQLAQLQKLRALRKPVLDARVFALQKRIQKLEQEIDEIVMEKLS